MELTGQNFIGTERVSSNATFKAQDPSTGALLEPPFAEANTEDVDHACRLADAAFDTFCNLPLSTRATFLEAIAAGILEIGDDLIERGHQETGLPKPRLQGERERTVGQLRMFADLIRDGAFQDKRAIEADPNREPLPRPRLEFRRIAIGPVAVFGASNFPLAFSVAGVDTVSALAAGCPVVVKGHPAHPGVSELVAAVIVQAAQKLNLPDGIFSLVHGQKETGAALVTHPAIKAVGFTGSQSGGRALMDLAAKRAEPIPVYAEMGSINPVVLGPAVLSKRSEDIAKGFVGSLTMGAGQFCTNPGLILAIDGPGYDAFKAAAIAALAAAKPATMLTKNIAAAYGDGLAILQNKPTTSLIAQMDEQGGETSCRGALFETSADAFIADKTLQDEVFGASSLIVRCHDNDQLKACINALEGQLTATLQIDTEDQNDTALAQSLVPLLERKAGRLIVNGWPTGVEVSPAMVHGGPFPATSDVRTSSVGTIAIERFLRPVCYQDFPAALLGG